MSRFIISNLPLDGLKLIERQRLGDARGFLSRLFCAEELAAAGWVRPVAQINHTFTAKRGTVRGMHFQRPPFAEVKLVQCIRGRIWDVAVDLRAGSPSLLRWYAQELSADNGLALLIPEGFAHGFQTLTDDVELLYCHSAAYEATGEGGICPTDSRLQIEWPLQIDNMSARDAAFPPLTETYAGLRSLGPA